MGGLDQGKESDGASAATRTRGGVEPMTQQNVRVSRIHDWGGSGQSREVKMEATENEIQATMRRPGGADADCAMITVQWSPGHGWQVIVHGNGGEGAPSIQISVPDVGRPFIS
jgi:hypothetical protein